jgi:hypothetical protein
MMILFVHIRLKRYKEHIQAIRKNNGNSRYSNHILNTGHAYRSITYTMKVIKIEKKGIYLNTLEKYHMYKMSRDGLQMNDICIYTYNPTFEVMPELNTRQQHTHTL